MDVDPVVQDDRTALGDVVEPSATASETAMTWPAAIAASLLTRARYHPGLSTISRTYQR